jgi:hypothetical protein
MGKASAFAYLFLAAPLMVAGCNQPPADTASTEASTEVTTTTTNTTADMGHAMLPANATDEQIIASAQAAAPAAIASGATVVAVGADGAMREVRKGTNGFTCMADNPATPGADPMCGDANAMEWAAAWIGKKTPPPNKVGFMYMMSGGTDASNTDPYATAPTAENNWIKTGPHVMVVGAKGMMEGYPASPTPDTSKPYVMWAGTPYEHLMLPVG